MHATGPLDAVLLASAAVSMASFLGGAVLPAIVAHVALAFLLAARLGAWVAVRLVAAFASEEARERILPVLMADPYGLRTHRYSPAGTISGMCMAVLWFVFLVGGLVAWSRLGLL